ncbi:MAG TPA: hypothetical protein VFV50_11335 [Bdellovibrionales bacterium]|nr:hypothetical protein [Bdellovibrionales bacterium]
MRTLLFEVFESHLLDADELGNIASSDFVERVVTSYLERLKKSGAVIREHELESVRDELRDEVLEMTRKKTYGYFSLQHYRLSKYNLK